MHYLLGAAIVIGLVGFAFGANAAKVAAAVALLPVAAFVLLVLAVLFGFVQ